MLVDCNACAARGPVCGECVVSALLGAPGGATEGGLAPDERAALDALAGGGLLPPLRLVHAVRSVPVDQWSPTRARKSIEDETIIGASWSRVAT
ncbi:MAG: hypothetical protein Q4F65_03175 [Propionibacteriaceae bacterium]|nr:hypothetical protein [Propionibacteriaceae bacterium]